MNKHMLRGHLGKDPEVRVLDFGTVVNCSIATTKKWKDKNTGERKEKTEWHTLEFFGAIAEVAAKFLKKGSNVLVVGESQTKEYTDKEGVSRRAVSVNVKELEMLDKREQQQQQAYQGPGGYRQTPIDEVPF